MGYRVAGVLLCILAGAPAAAQDLEVWLDGAGTHAQPPASVDTSVALYSLVGGRGLARFPWGDITVSGQYGTGVGALDARWIVGTADASFGRRIGRWVARGLLGLQLLDYTVPFDYSVRAATLEPSVSGAAGSLSYTVRASARVGSWTSSVPDITGIGMADPTTTVDGALRVLGGGVQAGHPLGPAWLTLDLEALDVTNGALDGGYLNGDLRASLPLGRLELQLWGSAQRNPLQTEWGYGASALWTPVGSTLLQLFVGRTVTDPLYGTEGSFSGGLSVSWRLARREAPPPPRVARPGAWVADGRTVHFRIRARHAQTVQLVGDFTGWEPVAMERHGSAWTTTHTLPPGVHHFGFLVDGEWTVPEDAPGVMEDGWGRRNASIVIEERGDPGAP